MPQVTGIRVQEAFVMTEFSLSEIKLLLEAMNRTEITCNLNDEKEAEYHKAYFGLYEFLKESLEGTTGVIERG